ncbi:hypothetical protein KNU14_gp78 [Gordonia phage Buggaboo]|uniref:Uncharacterized protein n=1 Tax=Gordonia phage Buggaboo TaxID=2315529 RepID=A0A386KD17_9CAUD|nr:hypothetical protein KNU14_gp78 [Gordonia phage Buggaboo]AVE00730.1 hypothetical protein SEA_SUPERSULLEY_78 [Gordonia phage SuperSulley]AYD83270.1 hypothetical protein SEA_BUGGABOO_78 [Gordonia phage Buggaboo]
MASKTKIQPRHTPANATDALGRDERMPICAPTTAVSGWIARREPPTVDDEPVTIYACELMGRDIGRYIGFVKRMGQDLESVKIVIAELRQIYMTGSDGETVTLNVAAGAEEEYSFSGTDQIFLYGDGVTSVPLNAFGTVDNDLRPIP